MNKLKGEELTDILKEAFEALCYRVDTGALEAKDSEAMVKAEKRKAYYNQAHQQIVALMQKPEVTQEFIDEQVDLIYRRMAVYTQNNVFSFEDVIKEAIRRTIKDMPAKKSTVTKAFVEDMTNRMEIMMMPKNSRRQDREYFIRCEVLRAAGVEEEE